MALFRRFPILLWLFFLTQGASPGTANDENLISSFKFCEPFGNIGRSAAYKSIKDRNVALINRGLSAVKLGEELKSLIARAQPHQTIFIDPACVIEVSGTIEINKPLVIASNRGENGSAGALIKSTREGNIVFRVTSDNVRITGIRFEGNESISTIDKAIYVADQDSSKINIRSFELDNCEFYQWAIAIEISHSAPLDLQDYNVNVHHNHFHDNLCPGYGYGVDVGNAFVRVFANLFGNNRHDIAAAGTPLSGYEAFCNVIREGSSEVANFDVHGGEGNTEDYAGGFFSIHHNDFEDLNCQANIFVVGRPTIICIIRDNKFRTPNILAHQPECPEGHAAIQNRPSGKNLKEGSPNAYGNVVAVNNIYDGMYRGWYVAYRWNPVRFDNIFRVPSDNDLLHASFNPDLISSGLINPAAQTLDYYFGDIDRDGRTDILRSDGKRLSYIPLLASFGSTWRDFTTSPGSFGKIAFNENTVSYDLYVCMYIENFFGAAAQEIATIDAETLRIHSLNGRLLTDLRTASPAWPGQFSCLKARGRRDLIVQASGDTFIILTDGRLQTIRGIKGAEKYLVGDFDGDGCSDLLVKQKSGWQYRTFKFNEFVILGSLKEHDEILVGNMTAASDEVSDVLGFVKGDWRIAVNGVDGWRSLSISDFPLHVFYYGDLK